MSRLNIAKKLLPAKKAWKSFKSSIQKKLHKLKKSKAIKKTTKHLDTVLRRKNKTLSRPSSHLRIHRKAHHFRPTYAPVYVHDLFMQPPVLQMTTNKVDKKGKVAANIDPGSSNKMVTEFSEEDNKMDRRKQKITNDVLVGCSSTSNSQLRCVDQRAEEFIAKFKEEMRLQEMLARTS